jgi:hypothetical protein
MSTSGLKGYINKGEYVAHYVSHDAYPSGLGWEFYKDCKNEFIDTIYDNRISFIKKSLFCEWAYFYDPENKIFEIWKGFQRFPDDNNPFGFEADEDGYYPCRRIFRGDINTIDGDIFLDDKNLIEPVLKSIERENAIKSILD